MKRPLSILMLLVFLFNLGGYYAIYGCLSYQAKIEINQRLDSSNYSSDEIVTTKIPLSIPYYFDRNDYERIDGSYEQDGEFFKLVKQKFDGDTLYIVSIKDHMEKKLFNSLVDFVRLSNDLPVSAHAIKVLGSLIKDFVPIIGTEISEPLAIKEISSLSRQIFIVIATELTVFSPPPEFIS